MCGIIGAIAGSGAGSGAGSDVVDTLIDGLRRLEYRGYDSAGVAICDETIRCVRRPGRVDDLARAVAESPMSGRVGIAHTRWATHGVPDEVNAHPHISEGRIAIVHNGVIENHNELRDRQIAEGFEFTSDTDTEVIAHQIVLRLREENDLLRAVWLAGRDLVGSYAVAVLDAEHPDRLIALRDGGPLLLGVGADGGDMSSDLQALRTTDRFVAMKNGEIAVVRRDGWELYDAELKPVEREPQKTPVQDIEAELGDYPHYMLKEIYEQPRVAADILEGRIGNDTVPDEAFGPSAPKILSRVRNAQIIACGSSYHAALVGKYWLEEFVGVPCQVEIASEFRYREQVAPPDTLLVMISQSGETADTLAAMEWAKRHDYLATLAICNVAQSSLVGEADLVLLTHAGPEIGVASTKAFTAQLIAQLLLTVALTKHRPGGREVGGKLVAQLRNLPARLERVFDVVDDIKRLAARCADKHHVLFLGRGRHYPIALEGALKMKEISYIHAEGYPAGELKHGPLALVDADMPVVAVAPNDHLLQKLRTNLREVEARGGQLHVLADAEAHADFADEDLATLIKLDAIENAVAPIVFTIPLQLLAYHTAVIRGTDVDKPRNLAKSVTVE